MRAAMTSPPQNGAQKHSDSGMTRAKAAAIWLYLVTVATILNSLILFKYSRFIDLFIGLSFTQFIDAIFVGMQLEPPGASWWVHRWTCTGVRHAICLGVAGACCESFASAASCYSGQLLAIRN
jgi:hypothetical protein